MQKLVPKRRKIHNEKKIENKNAYLSFNIFELIMLWRMIQKEKEGLVPSSGESDNKRRVSKEPKIYQQRTYLKDWFVKLPEISSYYRVWIQEIVTGI